MGFGGIHPQRSSFAEVLRCAAFYRGLCPPRPGRRNIFRGGVPSWTSPSHPGKTVPYFRQLGHLALGVSAVLGVANRKRSQISLLCFTKLFQLVFVPLFGSLRPLFMHSFCNHG